MPLNLPDLDDRSFEELTAEMRARIPASAPEWTDHNPSDPGITLLELFAYFGDALLYRLNRVSAENRWAFVRLLEGPGWTRPDDDDLESALRQAVLGTRETTRATTPGDVELLSLGADPSVARAVAVPGRDLSTGNPSPKPGHVSVIVLPESRARAPMPNDGLLERVSSHIHERRLLGTRLHVVAPRYVPLRVHLRMVTLPGVDRGRVAADVSERLAEHFHPLRGGDEGTGWPLGGDAPVSDLYRIAEAVPGVDYVTPIGGLEGADVRAEISVRKRDRHRLDHNESGELVAVRLDEGELFEFRLADSEIVVHGPRERSG